MTDVSAFPPAQLFSATHLQQPGILIWRLLLEHLVHRNRLMPTHHSIRCSLASDCSQTSRQDVSVASFGDMPNPFLQVGILDIRADTLLSAPRQPSKIPKLWQPRLRMAAVCVHYFGSPGGLQFSKLRIEYAVHRRDIICRNSTGPPTIHMHHAVPRGQWNHSSDLKCCSKRQSQPHDMTWARTHFNLEGAARKASASSENVDELSQLQEKLQPVESKKLGKPFEYEAHWRLQTRRDDLGRKLHEQRSNLRQETAHKASSSIGRHGSLAIPQHLHTERFDVETYACGLFCKIHARERKLVRSACDS